MYAAPTVEELDNQQTRSTLRTTEKSKQLFLSFGLTASYTYNNLVFTFVPAGFDFATSSLGNDWIYNRKR